MSIGTIIKRILKLVSALTVGYLELGMSGHLYMVKSIKKALKIILNSAKNAILHMTELKNGYEIQLNHYQKPIHIKIQSSQDYVNYAVNLIHQNAKNVVSAPILVRPNGKQRQEKLTNPTTQ